MAKLINKTQGYTIVGQNISMDERLGMKERGLFLTLLSLPDNWEFSVIGLSKILPDGKAAIQSTVQKLEKLGYLKRVQAKGERGKFAGYDWEIIPYPEVEAPLTENRSTDEKTPKSPLTENRSTENRSTENPSTENPSQLNTKVLNTNLSNTYVSNNQSIYPSDTRDIDSAPSQKREKMDRLIDGELIEETKKQIEYDVMLQSYNLFGGENVEPEDLDAAVEIIAALKATSEPQRFGDSVYDAEYVRKRGDSITSEHVRYVFKRFKEQSEIRNIRGYLRTSFFNAPVTYNASVNNELAVQGIVFN